VGRSSSLLTRLASAKASNAEVGGEDLPAHQQAAALLKTPPGRRASGGWAPGSAATGRPSPQPSSSFLSLDDCDRRASGGSAAGGSAGARRLGFTWGQRSASRTGAGVGGIRPEIGPSGRPAGAGKPPGSGLVKPTPSAAVWQGGGARRGWRRPSSLSCQGRQERLGERLARPDAPAPARDRRASMLAVGEQIRRWPWCHAPGRTPPQSAAASD